MKQVETKIKVIGIGGGGCNAVDNMILNNMQNVDFAIANTDVQALNRSKCSEKIFLGRKETKGMGAGADPEVGRKACIESEKEIEMAMKGYDMIFLAAGLGGGTGTNAISYFASVARKLNILSVAVITKPFSFEGAKRLRNAEKGLTELLKSADSTVVVSNNHLMQLIGKKPIKESFKVADDTLRQGIQTITNLISTKALINLDFADVKNTLKDKGYAILGIGKAKGSEEKAMQAAQRAVKPLLLEHSIKGATQSIINVTGGVSTTLFDAEDAVSAVREESGNDIDTIFGVAIDEKMEDEIMVTVIATGFTPVENKKQSIVSRVSKNAKMHSIPQKEKPVINEHYEEALSIPKSVACREIDMEELMEIRNRQSQEVESEVIDTHFLPAFFRKKRKEFGV